MSEPAAGDRMRRLARFAARVRRTRPLILMYHAFGSPPPSGDPYDLFLPTDHLASQLDLLLDSGWRALDLDEFLSVYDCSKGGTGCFHVTIDDGFASMVSEAAP